MNVREKLIEILKTKYDHFCDQCGINKDSKYTENLASYLIANGVTVQEWISVNDRLPENGDTVLCFMKFGGQRILLWDEASSWWLGYGSGDDWQKADVTHWQYLPKPPKGERL